MTKGSNPRFLGLFSRKGLVSSRQAVRRVQQAYAEAEHGGLQAAYADVRWRTRVLRSCLALADRLYPVTEAIHFAGEMDERIREHGLPEACRGGAELLRLDCEYVMSDATRETLASSPVIIYGNHPTLLTPFLVGAAARRADLRYFMMSYVGQLIPSLRPYMLPLELSSPSGWREWRRGGNRRMVAHWLTQVLEKGREPVDPKPANRQSLGRGAQHIHDGGCVVIFPSGGGRRDRAWYPGIGQLTQQLARDPAAPDVYLVPMREEQSSNDHVYRSLRGLSGKAPVVGSRLSPIRVRFAEPRRLKDLVPPDASRGEITRRLQVDYEKDFPPTRPHWVMRVLFPWRLAWGRGRV